MAAHSVTILCQDIVPQLAKALYASRAEQDQALEHVRNACCPPGMGEVPYDLWNSIYTAETVDDAYMAAINALGHQIKLLIDLGYPRTHEEWDRAWAQRIKEIQDEHDQ